ncbi:serine hydrolase [uncultured Maribacter sp.]|uniref:serine hydrolase n=1 Tax=uncultured Maribacter sp. TaxID=431308 RepID=UPI0030DBE32F|tara:strand:+ start:3046 stop:4554 length:1509 start_codon:yes stop_codon:yes gene_type:complete
MNSRKYLQCISIALFVVLGVSAQQKTPNKKLDAMIVQGMKDWKVPGLATIVVKDGEVVFQKAYGVKNLKTKEAVDENTLFNMASTTKAIVAIAMGMLVDDGKLNWDDKVTDHVPYFKLSDVYISADARVKDLLTHNLGIGNADALWTLDSLSTKETIQRFQFAEKTYPLRGGFTYQNIMYAVAGEVIAAASGKPWNEFVQQRIFNPLEMTRTQAIAANIFKAGNYVTPYLNDMEEGLIEVDYGFSDQIGPAGMICSTAHDMGNYLTFLVNDGVFKSDTLLQPKTFKKLFEPHSFLGTTGTYPTNALTKPNWNTYGLGWFQQDYKGHKLDFHTGSLFGLIALAGIIHDKDLAVYVFANLDHAELRHAIMYKTMDLFAFNDDGRDWHTEVFNLYQGFKKEGIEKVKKDEAERVKNTKPSLPLLDYEGTYKNKMLGSVQVALLNGKLQINFNEFITYSAEHWHYDTFITNKDPRFYKKLKVNFDLNEAGKSSRLNIMGEVFIKKK